MEMNKDFETTATELNADGISFADKLVDAVDLTDEEMDFIDGARGGGGYGYGYGNGYGRRGYGRGDYGYGNYGYGGYRYHRRRW